MQAGLKASPLVHGNQWPAGNDPATGAPNARPRWRHIPPINIISLKRPQRAIPGAPFQDGSAPMLGRGDFLVFYRRHLGYLNFIEKIHGTYCEHGNGLMGCRAEIPARTEPYFCPIKHAHKIFGTHARYNRFLDDGDAPAYKTRLEKLRVGAGQGQVTTARQRSTPVRAGAIRGAPRGSALSAPASCQKPVAHPETRPLRQHRAGQWRPRCSRARPARRPGRCLAV